MNDHRYLVEGHPAIPNQSSKNYIQGIGSYNCTLIQCSGNEEMRLFCLASGVPGVVRMGACLQCCVAIQRLIGVEAYTLC